jgi:hypothetical protein
LPSKLFQNERVSANWEVARILSAVPEVEGNLDEHGRGDFQPVPLPENCPLRCFPADVHMIVVLGALVPEAPEREGETWQWRLIVKELVAYLNEPAPPALTNREWECLMAMRPPSSSEGLSPNEVRSRLAQRPSLAVISDTLQTATEKGYLIEEQRQRPASATGTAVRTRGASGPETVYRLVPKKLAAALCQGLLAGAVAPSGEVRQALLSLVETLGVPPEILEQCRKG